MRDKDETKTTPLRTLNQGTIEGDATTVKVSKERKALREASKVKLLLVLLSVFVYVACFLLIYYTRDYGMGVVAVIPVVVVAWLYGCVPGIVAAVLTLPLNMFLNEYLGVEWIERMILRGASIQGTIALMLMGGAVGHLRDLNMRVKGELSHRKRAEEALKKAQDELEFRVKERTAELKKTKDHLDNIIESSLDCIIVTDDKGCITRVNKALLKLTGYEKEEIVGKSTMELSIPKEGTYETTTGEMVEIGEEHFNSALEIVEKLFEEGEIANWESYLLRKDKKIIPVGISMSLLYNEKGEVIGSIGINRDVTERKKIEKEVKEAKDFLENIFKTSADGLIIADASGVIIMANKSIASMLGYSPNELIGKTTSALNKGEMYRENASRFLTKLFEEGVITDYEFTWVKKDGNLIDVEVNAVLLRDHAGNDIGTVTTIRDITERKRAEEELEKTKERFKTIFEEAPLGVTLIDSHTGHIYEVNLRFAEIVGRTREELTTIDWMTFTHPDDLQEDLDNMALLNAGKIKGFQMEKRYIKPDGSVVLVNMTIAPVKVEDKAHPRHLAMIEDITRRKRIEEDVRKNREFLENIFRTSADGIMITDKKGVITMANDALENMLGYSKDELLGKHARGLVPRGKKYEEEGLDFMKMLYEKGTVVGRERVFSKKGRSKVYVEHSAAFLKDKKGNLSGSVGSIRDITERKKIQKTLKTSEEKYRGLFENANDAIVSTNEEFLILDFNKKAEELYGYSSDEIVGKPILILASPSEREKGIEQIEEFKKNRELIVSGRTVEREYLKKDGTIFLSECSTFSVELHGKYIFTLFIRDITERNRVEKALRESHENLRSLAGRLQTIQEDERIRISREIHDELGEKLTALNMGLSWLREKLPHDQVVLTGKVNEMSGLINETIQTVQKMATDLRPSILDNLGISAAIEWEIEEFQKRAEIVCDLTMDPENITLDKDYSTALFRILQETLTNVARHANANMVEVSLKKFDSKIELEVKDNGKGISKEQIFVSQSLGLIGMQERAHSLNGKIDISGIQGRGTTVTVTIPLDEKGQSR